MKMFNDYGVGELDKFVRDIEKYSIGMDEWLHRMGAAHETKSNYPPYNYIKLDNITFKLEIALAGFKKEEIKVYTENNKLFVEGKTAEKEELEYLHKGLATRDFTRVWTISDDVVLESVEYVDGVLTIVMKRVIPEHQKRKDWL